jgi:hypothetical protein
VAAAARRGRRIRCRPRHWRWAGPWHGWTMAWLRTGWAALCPPVGPPARVLGPSLVRVLRRDSEKFVMCTLSAALAALPSATGSMCRARHARARPRVPARSRAAGGRRAGRSAPIPERACGLLPQRSEVRRPASLRLGKEATRTASRRYRAGWAQVPQHRRSLCSAACGSDRRGSESARPDPTGLAALAPAPPSLVHCHDCGRGHEDRAPRVSPAHPSPPHLPPRGPQPRPPRGERRRRRAPQRECAQPAHARWPHALRLARAAARRRRPRARRVGSLGGRVALLRPRPRRNLCFRVAPQHALPRTRR